MSKTKPESGHLSDERLVQVEASAVNHDADADADEIAAMASELRWRRREALKDSKLAEEVKRTRWHIEHALTKIENLDDAVRDRQPRSGPLRRVLQDAASSMGFGDTFVDIVFDGPPGHESGRFVEVEDADGKSISIGSWVDRGKGMWALRVRLPLAAPAPSIGTAGGTPVPIPPTIPAHLMPDLMKQGAVLIKQARWLRALLAELGSDHPIAVAAVSLCNEDSTMDIDDLRRVIEHVGQQSFEDRLKLLPERLIMGPIPQPLPDAAG